MTDGVFFISFFIFTCQDSAVAAAKDAEKHNEATSYFCDGSTERLSLAP